MGPDRHLEERDYPITGYYVNLRWSCVQACLLDDAKGGIASALG